MRSDGKVVREAGEELGRAGLEGQLERWEVGRGRFVLYPEDRGLHLKKSKGKPAFQMGLTWSDGCCVWTRLLQLRSDGRARGTRGETLRWEVGHARGGGQLGQGGGDGVQRSC